MRILVVEDDKDVGAFVVSDDDLKELRDCKPNSCNFKLPATDMAHARAAATGSSADARERVAAYARQRMIEYVTDYRARGNAAMIVYDDLGSVRDDTFLAKRVPPCSQCLVDARHSPP